MTTLPPPPKFNHTLGFFALSIALEGVPPRKFDPDKLDD